MRAADGLQRTADRVSHAPMLSIFDHGPPARCPAPFNLAGFVLRATQANANRTALMVLGADGSENWTYEQLTAAVRGTGTGLLEAGLRPCESRRQNGH